MPGRSGQTWPALHPSSASGGIEQDEIHFGTAQQRIAEAISIRDTQASQIELFEARA
ncbi:hypothetical protein CSV86_009870 [Pseudomonas putida CSV86]|uniref:Uncharacterized protein n=1 Tax=Pseudomonas bharatica CSV86 TaxID=1005395 RepID=L1M6L6_9PSED|nr:hypothetical protein [Pseudomonas bharatica]NNJ15519.1 hypothetical protein [Pseudomonas bharatica CSV86]